MPDLTDDALKALQDRLNRFEPKDIHDALDEMDLRSLPGNEAEKETTASGSNDFGSMEAGVLLYRLEPGKVRIRLTMAEITGGSYDDVELSDENVAQLVVTLVARLESEGTPEAP